MLNLKPYIFVFIFMAELYEFILEKYNAKDVYYYKLDLY